MVLHHRTTMPYDYLRCCIPVQLNLLDRLLVAWKVALSKLSCDAFDHLCTRSRNLLPGRRNASRASERQPRIGRAGPFIMSEKLPLATRKPPWTRKTPLQLIQ